jgi:hypothetical protein
MSRGGIRGTSAEVLEAPFEMANLFPKHTGLPFVVWISVWSHIKVSASAKAVPRDATAEENDLLQKWIDLNRATLLSYREGEIDIQDALGALVKVDA